MSVGMRRLSNFAARIGAWWLTYGIFAWTAAVIATGVLGFIGFSEHFQTGERDIWDRTYLTFQLLALEGGTPDPPVPWEIEVARVAAPLLAALGVVGVASLFLRAITQQDWRLQWARNHTIVCGLGERGSATAKALLDPEASPKRKVVVVETGANAEDVEACRNLGAVVVRGDATDPAVLERARIERARELVVMCGTDGTNGEIAANAVEVVSERTGDPLRIYVQIGDPEFQLLIKARLASTEWRQDRAPHAELVVINVFDRLADAMLDQPNSFPEGHGPDETLVVLGLGNAGRSVLTRALARWREAHPDGTKLRVLVMDRDAKMKVEQLELLDENVQEYARVDTWEEDIAGPSFDRGEYRAEHAVGRILVCFNDDHLALTSTMRLRRLHPGVPLSVRMSRQEAGLTIFLKGDAAEPVQSFGIDGACDRRLLDEQAGRAQPPKSSVPA